MTLTYFTARSNLVTYAFLWEKVKTVDFSETIAACDLIVGRCRQLIEIMKVLCFTRPRYQVSVYRTIGPLVSQLGSYYNAIKVCILTVFSFRICINIFPLKFHENLLIRYT